MSLINNSAIMKGADFVLTWKDVKGRKYNYRGTAQINININQEAEYGDIHLDGDYNSVRPYTISRDITITLNNVQPQKENPVEKVETTRKIKVDNFTFESVANARKRAGAPKNATFECTTARSDGYSLSEYKVVVFTWNEEL